MMNRASIGFLKRVPILAGLDDDDLQRLVPLLQPRHYRKGEIVFLKDDPGDALYLIQRGAVKIYLTAEDGTEKTLAILQAGEFFGEMALLDDEPRSAIAEALEPCHLLALTKGEFTSLLMSHPPMALKIIRTLCARLRRMNAQVEALRSQDAASRIMNTLMDLAQRYGRDTPRGRRIELKLTHQELANLAGTSRETVTRLLCSLQEEGVVTMEGRHWVLTNFHGVAWHA